MSTYTNINGYLIDTESIELSLQSNVKDDKDKENEDKNGDTRDVVASCIYNYRGQSYKARAIVIEGFTEVLINLDDPNEELSFRHGDISDITDEAIIKALTDEIKLRIDSTEIANKRREFENGLNKFFNNYKYKG